MKFGKQVLKNFYYKVLNFYNKNLKFLFKYQKSSDFLKKPKDMYLYRYPAKKMFFLYDLEILINNIIKILFIPIYWFMYVTLYTPPYLLIKISFTLFFTFTLFFQPIKYTYTFFLQEQIYNFLKKNYKKYVLNK